MRLQGGGTYLIFDNEYEATADFTNTTGAAYEFLLSVDGAIDARNNLGDIHNGSYSSNLYAFYVGDDVSDSSFIMNRGLNTVSVYRQPATDTNTYIGGGDEYGTYFILPNGSMSTPSLTWQSGMGAYSTPGSLVFRYSSVTPDLAEISTAGFSATGYGIINETNPLAGGIALGSTGVLAWQGTYPTLDTGISRDSADVIDFGNGSQGDASAKARATLYQMVKGTYSALPSCGSGTEGTMGAVTDGSTATWGATLAGSGSNHVLAYCDGTNWTVVGK
jgi:hypothetical protein